VRVELDTDKATSVIGYFAKSTEPCAFDFETDRLKPDAQDSNVLCCSISNGTLTIAFPWQGAVIPAMKEFIRSPVPKIGANIKFEERWSWRHLGCGVRNWFWDTMLGAHWDRCQSGVCGLKFQAFVRLGVPDYALHLEPLMRAQDSNSPNRLREADLREVLLYCGTDSLLEVKVAQLQQKELPP
jgi:hypothetical protein